MIVKSIELEIKTTQQVSIVQKKSAISFHFLIAANTSFL